MMTYLLFVCFPLTRRFFYFRTSDVDEEKMASGEVSSPVVRFSPSLDIVLILSLKRITVSLMRYLFGSTYKLFVL